MASVSFLFDQLLRVCTDCRLALNIKVVAFPGVLSDISAFNFVVDTPVPVQISLRVWINDAHISLVVCKAVGDDIAPHAS